jgi:hypothetical protein
LDPPNPACCSPPVFLPSSACKGCSRASSTISSLQARRPRLAAPHGYVVLCFIPVHRPPRVWPPVVKLDINLVCKIVAKPRRVKLIFPALELTRTPPSSSSSLPRRRPLGGAHVRCFPLAQHQPSPASTPASSFSASTRCQARLCACSLTCSAGAPRIRLSASALPGVFVKQRCFLVSVRVGHF